MARKGKSTEEVIGFLREAEVRLAQGETAGKVCRGAGISEQTHYKWRSEYGGLKIDQAKHLKELERENERLKKVVSEHNAGSFQRRATVHRVAPPRRAPTGSRGRHG